MPGQFRTHARANLAIVLDHLRRHGPASRSQLVAATGLHAPRDRRSRRRARIAAAGDRGRPGIRREPRSALAGPRSTTATSGPWPSRSSSTRSASRSWQLRRIDRVVDPAGTATEAGGSPRRSATSSDSCDGSSAAAAPHDLGQGDRRIIGIGVSVPGLIRASDNVVVGAPDLGWTNTAVAELLDDAFFEGRSADPRWQRRRSRALAESRFGAGVGSRPHALRHRRGGRGWRIRGRGSPVQANRIRRRDRPTSPSTRPVHAAPAAPSAAGRPRSGSGRCSTGPASTRTAAARALDEMFARRPRTILRHSPGSRSSQMAGA